VSHPKIISLDIFVCIDLHPLLKGNSRGQETAYLTLTLNENTENT